MKYVHIIPIESITDKMCPAFKDEFVNNLSEREVLPWLQRPFRLNHLISISMRTRLESIVATGYSSESSDQVEGE